MERRTYNQNYEFCPTKKPLPLVPNTEPFISEANYDNVFPLLNKAMLFAQTTSKAMGQDFISHYRNYQQEVKNNPDPKSLKLLVRNNLHLPRFSIFDKDYAQALLADTPFEEDEGIQDDSLVMIFRFPKLISRWNRLAYETDFSRKKSVIQWDRFIHPLKKELWRSVKTFSEKNEELEFDRINGIGDHEADVYHYMWEVKLPEKNKPSLHVSKQPANHGHNGNNRHEQRQGSNNGYTSHRQMVNGQPLELQSFAHNSMPLVRR